MYGISQSKELSLYFGLGKLMIVIEYLTMKGTHYRVLQCDYNSVHPCVLLQTVQLHKKRKEEVKSCGSITI